MKNPYRKTVMRLEALPNIGPAMAADLRLLGIEYPKDLTGQDPFALYERLCAETGKRIDPCVLDVFISVVDFMAGGEARPWWAFTARRKKTVEGKERPWHRDVRRTAG